MREESKAGATRQAIESRDPEKVKPWWVDWCFIVGGVGCNWYLAFKWFSGRYPFWSLPVLRGMGLAVVLCFCITSLAVRIFGGKLREGGAAIFCATSITLLGNMLMYWTSHR